MSLVDAAAPVRWLALGDSYTIGEGVSPAERWPARLATLLRDAGVRLENPTIVARTGWTTDELSAGIDAAGPRGPFELVTLLIGVNDQYRGRSGEAYREGLRPLLDRAVAFAGGQPERVLVLSIPDWGVTPFAEGRDRAAIARAIDAFNAVNRGEARRMGARHADITVESRLAAGDPTLIASDGLHPSGAMHARWAMLLLPLALEMLHDDRSRPARAAASGANPGRN